MTTTQLDLHRQGKAGTLTDAEIASNAAIALTKLAATVLRADGGQAMTADLPAGGFKVTGLGTPTASGDAATKSYVDSLSAGLDPKASVRVATTTAGTLSSSFANGQTVDGVTLVTGDRILIKNQATGTENGIYTVNSSGSPTRATDADSSAEMTPGIFTFVEEGTTNQDTGWVLATNAPITLGTTSLTFTQFSSAAAIAAGAGLTKTGNTIDVVSSSAALTVNTDDIALTLGTLPGLEIHTSGLRLLRGTSGQILVCDASGNTTYVAMSGDVTISNSGVATAGSTIQRTANFVDKETPSGSVNSSNVTFTLANTPVTGSEHVYLNGILQEAGAGNDYTISGATITYLAAPVTGDRIRVSYRK